MTVRQDIERLLSDALGRARELGILPDGAADAVVERPQQADHGDYASSLPLKLARPMRMAPMAIAEKLAALVSSSPYLGSVSVAKPGFINFTLDGRWLADQVEQIRLAGTDYGNSDAGRGQSVQVEFVSVNPTGPLHVGHARGAVIGSALADILDAAGYDVQREYYVNDAGTQMDLFGRSLYCRYLQESGREADLPPDGYAGEYMVELAREIIAQQGDRYLSMSEAEAAPLMRELGLEKMVSEIKVDLQGLRVEFDEWFSERSLYRDGQYERSMKILADGGFVADKDGATWFTATDLGADKDEVLIRSTGDPGYFASDVAYHYNKLVERGFGRVIDIWGADHQGHVPRMKSLMRALGIEEERLVLMIYQLVTFNRGGEVVRLSKRAGDLITVRELVDEVGADACRFFFLSRTPESHMEFDLELAKQESRENPVYYVQYAHARIAAILRLAAERKIEYRDGDTSLLTHEAELALVRKMLVLPELVEMMASSLEPHHLPHYATELATAFHWFYQQCRVISSEPDDLELTRARVKLVDAARVVLARCLGLMSMTAPERM